MAYTPCAAVLAANIAKNCANPIVGGYTGRAILIPAEKVVFTTSGTNPRIVTAITLSDLAKDKVCVVDNVWPNGFDGSQTASNGDDGRVVYEKTFGFRIPLRGGGNSKDVVEPLMDNPLGYVAIIEKKDRVGDGSYEVVGKFQALHANADGITRNEHENGGDVSVVMSCKEQYFEVAFFDTDYATTKTAFEALISTYAF